MFAFSKPESTKKLIFNFFCPIIIFYMAGAAGLGLGVLDSKSTKGQIVQVLSEEWPLNAKQVHSALVRKHSSTASYQAVHKAMTELCESAVLQKIDGKLRLSPEWVKQVSAFGKRLELSFQRHADKNEPLFFTFNSFIVLAKFLINEFIDYNSDSYPNVEKKDCVCKWRHAWPIVGASEQEHERMKKAFKETTHYCICKNDSFLDRMTMDYVAKLGKKTLTSSQYSSDIDTFVQGDYIMHVYFPDEMQGEIDAIYKSVESEKDFDMQKMLEFGSKKREIKAVIFKNGEFADSLREEAKTIFTRAQKQEVGAR